MPECWAKRRAMVGRTRNPSVRAATRRPAAFRGEVILVPSLELGLWRSGISPDSRLTIR